MHRPSGCLVFFFNGGVFFCCAAQLCQPVSMGEMEMCTDIHAHHGSLQHTHTHVLSAAHTAGGASDDGHVITNVSEHFFLSVGMTAPRPQARTLPTAIPVGLTPVCLPSSTLPTPACCSSRGVWEETRCLRTTEEGVICIGLVRGCAPHTGNGQTPACASARNVGAATLKRRSWGELSTP